MTKQERERVRRHAAIIAITSLSLDGADSTRHGAPEGEIERWDALGRWRGDDNGLAEGADQGSGRRRYRPN